MTRRIQQGFAVIAAIFLVVLLAALGGFMLSFSNTQQLTSAQDVVGSRAYWAAQAGVEWGVSSVNANSSCFASPTTLTVDTFTVTATCSASAYTDSGTVTIYTLTSTATLGTAGSPGRIERSLTATLEK